MTHGVTLLHALFLTNVVGTQATAALMITQRHAPAAIAANNQALEQGGTFPGRPALSLNGTRLLVVFQAILIFLKFLPADIAGMGVLDQNRPFLTRQTDTVPSPLRIFPGTVFSETKRSGVTRIVQSIQSLTVMQRLPDQLAGAPVGV